MRLSRTTLTTLTLSPLLVATASAQISFTPGGSVPTGQRADGPVLVDLDGDGTLDLAVTSDGAGNQDFVELYRGLGNGQFALAGTVFLPNGSSPHSLAAADTDGDQDLDLAVTLKNSNQLALLRNDGPFLFTIASTVSTGGSEPRVVLAADMDGDGDSDFVTSNRNSNNVSVVLNQAGLLSAAGTFPAGLEPRDISAADFDGDGRMDIVAAAHDSRQVVVLRGTGGGALASAGSFAVPAGTRPEGIAVGDIDGDGDMDVVAGTGDDNNAFQNFASVYTNNGGTLSGPIPYPSGGLDAGDVLLADLDADGDLDVAVLNETSGSIAFLANLGGGTFGAPSTMAFGPQPSTIVGGDIDGNGSTDIAVTRRQAAGVSLFINDTSGGGPNGIGSNFCFANLNSSGQTARMSASGSTLAAANDVTVRASRMPAQTFAFFIVSRSTGFVANPGGSAGNLCLGGSIGRYSSFAQNSGAAGEISQVIDLTAIPLPNGSVAAAAGDTWRFQAWFRDAQGGQATSNFTDGLAITLQ